MKKLGILGGLGPMATIYFMELVVRMTKADNDNGHIPMIIYNYPDTPDRTEYLLDHSKPNPLPNILEMGENLKKQGCEYFAMPCITAHYFGKEITETIGSGFINMIEETAKFLNKKKIDTVGLMATDGTVKSKVFEDTLNAYGINVVVPSDEKHRLVMKVIYDEVKAGKEVSVNDLYEVKEELKSKGAKLCLLGCTELSVVKGNYTLDDEFLDVLEILAKQAVLLCGAMVNSEYDYLM